MKNDYEEDKKINKDHVATPRWVVEDIYNLINIENYKSIWFPFNNYDSQFKLKADELKLKYKPKLFASKISLNASSSTS